MCNAVVSYHCNNYNLRRSSHKVLPQTIPRTGSTHSLRASTGVPYFQLSSIRHPSEVSLPLLPEAQLRAHVLRNTTQFYCMQQSNKFVTAVKVVPREGRLSLNRTYRCSWPGQTPNTQQQQGPRDLNEIPATNVILFSLSEGTIDQAAVLCARII